MKNINETKTINNTSEGDAATMKNLYVFNNQHYFEKNSAIFLKRGDKSYNILEITADFKNNNKENKIFLGHFSCRIVSQAWNRMSHNLRIQNEYVITQFGDATWNKKKTDTNIGGWDIVNRKMNHAKRFTFDEIQLKIVGKNSAIQMMNAHAILIYGAGTANMRIVLHTSTKDGNEHFIRIDDRPAHETKNGFKTYKTLSVMDAKYFVDENNKYKLGILVYPLGRSLVKDENGETIGFQSSSASQMKAYTLTIPEASNVKRLKERFYEDTNGTYKSIFNKRKELSLKKIAGLANRLSLAKPSTGLWDSKKFHLKAVAIYMGKFADKEGNEWMDGEHLGAAESLAQAINVEQPNKYAVTSDSLIGVHAQNRPFAGFKTKARFVQAKEIKYLVKNMKKEIVVLYKDKITEDIQDNFDLGVKYGEGIYADKIVIVCDKDYDPFDNDNIIDAFVDLNGLKISWDLKTDSNWHILKFSHADKLANDGGKTSNQLIQSMITADAEGTIAWLTDKLVQQEVTRRSSIDDSKVKNISGDSFNNLSLDVATIAMQIAPNYVKTKDQYLFRSFADNFIKGSVNRVSNCTVPLSGAYLMVSPDIATFYNDLKILGIVEENGKKYVEVLCPHAERLGIKYFVCIKYPKMHTQEFMLCKVVSIEEYCNRVDKLNLPLIEKEFIKTNACHSSEGILVIPSIELLKNQMAGLDFDSDSAQCFYDKFVVDTISKLDMLAVKIEAPTNTMSKHMYSSTLGMGMLAKYAMNEDMKNVGQVTVMNEVFIELARLLRNGSYEEIDMALGTFHNIFNPEDDDCDGDKCIRESTSSKKRIQRDFDQFGNACNTIKLSKEGLKYITVSMEYAKDIVYIARHMRLTPDNALKVLDALQSIERMYQELTIDAVKNAYDFTIPYEVSKYAKLKSREKIDFKILWNNKDKKFEYTADLRDTEMLCNNSNTLMIKDITQYARISGFDEIKKSAEKLLSINQKVDSLIINLISSALSDPVKKEVSDAIYSQRKIFGDINNLKIKELNLIKEDDDSSSKQFINDKYNELFKVLANNIRIIFKEAGIVNNDDKMSCLFAAVAKENINTNGEINFDASATNYIAKLLPEEYILFILDHYAETCMTKNKVLSYENCKDGDKIIFTNGTGVNKEGGKVITDASLNGEFIFRKELIIKRCYKNKVIHSFSNKNLNYYGDIKNSFKTKYSYDKVIGEKVWIEKPIKDFIQIPEVDLSQRLFITNDYKNDSENVLQSDIDELCVSAEVMLSASGKTGNGTINSIIDKTGRATRIGRIKVSNSKLERKLYHNFRGTISLTVSGSVKNEGKRNAHICVGILSNVKEASQEEIKFVQENNVQIDSNVTESKVEVKSKLLQSMENKLNNQNIVDEKNKNVKKETISKPSTLMRKMMDSLLEKEKPQAKESTLLKDLKSACGSLFND